MKTGNIKIKSEHYFYNPDINNDLALVLETEYDLSNTTYVKVGYETPNGTRGYWSGYVKTKTKIVCTPNNFYHGTWIIWSIAHFNNGVLTGHPVKYTLQRSNVF